MFCPSGRSCDYMILTDKRIFVYKLPSKFVRCSGGLHVSMSDQIKWHQVKWLVTSRWGSSIFTALYFIMGWGNDIFVSIYQLLLKHFFLGLCRSFGVGSFLFILVCLLKLYSCNKLKGTSFFLSILSCSRITALQLGKKHKCHQPEVHFPSHAIILLATY